MSTKIKFLKTLNRLFSIAIAALVISAGLYVYFSLYSTNTTPAASNEASYDDLIANAKDLQLQENLEAIDNGTFDKNTPLHSTPLETAAALSDPKSAELYTLTGKKIPPFQIENLSSDDFPNGPLILNFFSAWCEQSQNERGLWKRFTKDYDIPVFGINIYKRPEDPSPAEFLGADNNPYTRWGIDTFSLMSSTLKIYETPITMILDETHTIIFISDGEVTHESLYLDILPIIDTLSGAAPHSLPAANDAP